MLPYIIHAAVVNTCGHMAFPWEFLSISSGDHLLLTLLLISLEEIKEQALNSYVIKLNAFNIWWHQNLHMNFVWTSLCDSWHSASRGFSFISDVITTSCISVINEKPGHIFQVCYRKFWKSAQSETPHSFNEVTDLLNKTFSLRAEILRNIPANISNMSTTV